MGIKIIATPDPGTAKLGGAGIERAIALFDQGAGPYEHTHLKGWTSLQALIDQIDATLNASPHDCLEILEIFAHGSPLRCNGIDAAAAATIGTALKDRHQRLCDVTSVYLSGCNTAVRTARSESIAQILSRHAPTLADHNVRVTVCGSVGYLRGTHMIPGARTKTELVDENDVVYAPPYPDVTDENAVDHPGSRAATGNDVWRCFREGNPV